MLWFNIYLFTNYYDVRLSIFRSHTNPLTYFRRYHHLDPLTTWASPHHRLRYFLHHHHHHLHRQAYTPTTPTPPLALPESSSTETEKDGDEGEKEKNEKEDEEEDEDEGEAVGCRGKRKVRERQPFLSGERGKKGKEMKKNGNWIEEEQNEEEEEEVRTCCISVSGSIDLHSYLQRYCR